MNTEDKTMEMDNTQLTQENKKSNVSKRALFTAAAAILGGGAATAAAVEGKRWYDDWMQEHKEKEEEHTIEEEKFVHEPKKEELKTEPKPESKPEEPKPEEPKTEPENPYDIEVVGKVEQVEIGGEMVNALPVMVNGHEGYLIDQDGDGIADYIIYDENDNEIVDKGEVVNLEEQGIVIEMPIPEENDDYTIDAVIDQEYQNIEGDDVLVTKAIVNGHPAVLYDLDSDGNVDFMIIDSNDDGDIAENEIIDLTDKDIAMVVPVPTEEPDILEELQQNGLNITEVHDFEVYEDADGNLISYAKVNINGHEAVIFDSDGDGFGDALAIDVDDNYVIENGEAIDLRDIGAGNLVPMKEIAEAGGFNYDSIIEDYPPIDDNNDVAFADDEETEDTGETPDDDYEMLAVVEEENDDNDTAGFDPNYTGEEVNEDFVADSDETIEDDVISDDNIG